MDPIKTELPNTVKGEFSQAGTSSVGANEQRFDRMVSEVEDYAIILLDTNGLVTTWNKGAEAIKGYTAGEVIGRSYKIFYPPEDIQTNLPGLLLDEAKEKGKASHEG